MQRKLAINNKVKK